MMNKLLILAIASVLPGLAQTDCSQIVLDQTKLLSSGDIAKIEIAAQPLISQGADVHVVTIDSSGQPNLDIAEKRLASGCPEWHSPDGGVKTTILVLAVDAKRHKTGIYYGEAWKGDLDSRYAEVESRDMNPRFKNHDFVGGLSSGEESLAKIITANRDEARRGTTIVNEAPKPVDTSGLWSFLDYALLGILLLSALVVAIILVLKRKQKRDETNTMQQAAITARNLVADKLQVKNKQISDLEAMGDQARLDIEKDRLRIANDAYALLLNSPRMDPDSRGLTCGQYKTMRDAYQVILKKLDGATAYRDRPAAGSVRSAEMPNSNPSASDRIYTGSPNYAPPQQIYVRDDSGNQFINGVMVGELTSDRHTPAASSPSSTYTTPTTEPSPPAHISSSNYETGGSSSWSSSSSDSSGGSSSWSAPSSSSDFGSSGGSSDW